MALLEEKIAEIKDPELRRIIEEEVKALKKDKPFGLVFERHQPEVAPLYQARITRRETVAKRAGNLAETYRVESIQAGQAHLIKDNDDSRETVPLADLVVVRRMGEPIYPALIPRDHIGTTDTKTPHHILIEADNYHALQLLGYMYAGKVDCIYIDPPYNKGAKDWKYNNNYVDKTDQFRHSKWLAFMEKRLELARRLLNPEQSVLIVTIDEDEVLRLGLLLEQVFPGCKIQKTTIVVNPKGTARYNEFSRVEEYAFFVFVGDIKICPFGSDLLTSRDYSSETKVRWRGLARTGRKGLRSNNPGSWYPIFLNTSDYTINSIGAPITQGDDEYAVPTPKGTIAVWPPTKNGKQYSWGTIPATLRQIWEKGGFKTGIVNPEKKRFPFYYLSSGLFDKIENGQISVVGRGIQNELLLFYAEGQKQAMPRAVWNRVEYDAGTHGTGILQSILGDTSFPFPKSLYAVRDAIRLFVNNNKHALILDFFAGSGTTLNAINLLNATDGGQRQCIMVTNNEVSEEEAHTLASQGYQPGQPEWDQHGICQSVTWPRSKFTIQGHRDDGTPLPGDYLTGKQVAREKPRTIRQLGFAEGRHLSVAQRKQIAALLPTVPQNKMDDSPWFLDDEIAVAILWDVQQAGEWLDELTGFEHVTEVYVVTQENRLFSGLKTQIAETLGPLTVMEDEKRPLAAGFPANLDYFKLDFLQPADVAMGRQFAAILPVLWMKAGAIGPCPEPPAPNAHWLIPTDCPFVVLMRESRFREFLEKVRGRADLTHVYLVTNSDSAFHDMRAELPDHLEIIQLYKSYLENFRINTPTPSRSQP